MIGILGGTFNPLNMGHILLAKGAAEQCALEKVLLIPTNVPPHKAAPELADAHHRLNFCRIAAGDDPLFEACDIEIARQGRSYTSDTLEELKAMYPERELALIMGGDMFLSLRQWVRWRDIIRLAVICTAVRRGCEGDYDGYKAGLEREGARIITMPLELPELSSTELRAKLRRGDNVSGLIPDGVAEYISRNGLYTDNGK